MAQKTNNPVMKGIIIAAAASVMWGISGTTLQLISQNLAIPAAWMLSIRTFSAGIILLVISGIMYGKKPSMFLNVVIRLFLLFPMLFLD